MLRVNRLGIGEPSPDSPSPQNGAVPRLSFVLCSVFPRGGDLVMVIIGAGKSMAAREIQFSRRRKGTFRSVTRAQG
jgi:hypothetical protein